jgi:hypothetical protein
MADADLLSRFVDQRKDERFKSNLAIKLAQGKGIAHNVSASGIYFVTDVALPQGKPVKFTFEFQVPGGAIHLNCIARVVRVEKRGNKKGVGAAIDSFEFLRIPRSSDQGH